MILLEKIYIKYIKFCLKHIVYEISQISTFNGEYSDMPILKTLKKDHP